jgi:hypothetical protein
MYDGFFIMKPTIITTSQDSWDLCSTEDVVFEIDINAGLAFPLTVGLNGLGGASASAAVINNQGVVTVTITGISTLSPGNYTPNLLLISNFGEQYEIPLEVNVCNTINVSESVSAQVTVFPNPVQSEFQIQLDNQVETIELFDALGKRVMSISTNNQLSLKVDVRSLAEGAYTLKAGDETVRVVVAK